MPTDAELIFDAAEKLRDPLLCNWDREVAEALADLLQYSLGYWDRGGTYPKYVVAVARAVLRELGPATLRESKVEPREAGSVALPQAAGPAELSVTTGGEAARVAPPKASQDLWSGTSAVLREPEGGETP